MTLLFDSSRVQIYSVSFLLWMWWLAKYLVQWCPLLLVQQSADGWVDFVGGLGVRGERVCCPLVLGYVLDYRTPVFFSCFPYTSPPSFQGCLSLPFRSFSLQGQRLSKTATCSCIDFLIYMCICI